MLRSDRWVLQSGPRSCQGCPWQNKPAGAVTPTRHRASILFSLMIVSLRFFYAATAVVLLLRSGSYTAWVHHSRCMSTASFRATATTARFLAFLPPR